MLSGKLSINSPELKHNIEYIASKVAYEHEKPFGFVLQPQQIRVQQIKCNIVYYIYIVLTHKWLHWPTPKTSESRYHTADRMSHASYSDEWACVSHGLIQQLAMLVGGCQHENLSLHINEGTAFIEVSLVFVAVCRALVWWVIALVLQGFFALGYCRNHNVSDWGIGVKSLFSHFALLKSLTPPIFQIYESMSSYYVLRSPEVRDIFDFSVKPVHIFLILNKLTAVCKMETKHC